MRAELCPLEHHNPHPSTSEPVKTWKSGGILVSVHIARIKYLDKSSLQEKRGSLELISRGPVYQGRRLKQPVISFLQSENDDCCAGAHFFRTLSIPGCSVHAMA